MDEGSSPVLQSLLKCAICQGKFREPRVLPCQHNFCCQCLLNTVLHQVKAGSLSCPVCDNPCQLPQAGVDALPKNIFVSNVIKIGIKGKNFCSDFGEVNSLGVDGACAFPYGNQSESSEPSVSHSDLYEVDTREAHSKLHEASTLPEKKKQVILDFSPKETFPQCSVHEHMYIELFCEDCETPTCITCVAEEHYGHTCVYLDNMTESFLSQLEEVLTQINSCLQVVQKTIHKTKQQAIKAKQDVEVIKQKTSASYDKTSSQPNRQFKCQHLAQIDQAYQQAHQIITETLDRQQTTEATLHGLMLYGHHLKTQGTTDDFATNLESFERMSEEEVRKPHPTELRWAVDIKYVDCNGNDDVTWAKVEKDERNVHSSNNLEQVVTFVTHYQGNHISGLVSYQNHLFIIHRSHSKMYIYDDEGNMKSSVKVEGMKNPSALCMAKSGGTTYLVVTDFHSHNLWWLTVEENDGEVRLGQIQSQRLSYPPLGLANDGFGKAVEPDCNNRRMYLYSQPGEEGICIQLSQEVRPVQAVGDSEGGYVVCNQNYQLVWVDKSGKMSQPYNDKPALCVSHLVDDETQWLIADWDNQCIHMVTREGRHGGHLLTLQTGVRPTRVAVSEDHNEIYLAVCNNQYEVMKLKYQPSHMIMVTLAVMIPKLK